MPNYQVHTCTLDGRNKSVIKQRFDAFRRAAHQAIYDAAEAQGLRDTQCAWDALCASRAIAKGQCLSLTIGSYTVILCAGSET